MKNLSIFNPVAIGLLLFSVCLVPSRAQGSYEIPWSIIDGGGGQSSGGTYKLTGTIG
jgi:hypothetical protein